MHIVLNQVTTIGNELNTDVAIDLTLGLHVWWYFNITGTFINSCITCIYGNLYPDILSTLCDSHAFLSIEIYDLCRS